MTASHSHILSPLLGRPWGQTLHRQLGFLGCRGMDHSQGYNPFPGEQRPMTVEVADVQQLPRPPDAIPPRKRSLISYMDSSLGRFPSIPF